MEKFISTVNTAIMSSNIKTPIIVYIGVGTAAGTYTMIDNHKIVEPTNYHQYPKVLHDMENVLRKNAKKYILLIDPCMEDIPHITQDMANGFNFFKQSDNVYVDYENQIFLHVLRENVTHDAYSDMQYGNNGYNITSSLSELIEICKSEYCNMIYHDFSGRQLLPIYNHHEDQIGEHSNHIVFGLGAQGDFGCYFDMTSPIATFAMKPDVSPRNRVFVNICSPRSYLKQNMSIDQARHDYPDCNVEVLQDQFSRICKDKFDELVSRVFYKLRFLKQLQKKTAEEIEKLDIKDLYAMYGKYMAMTILQQIEDKNLDLAFIEALEFYGPQYDSICIHSKLPFRGIDLLYKITSDAKDEYSWATELRKYIEY
jgi:hypothetical protein